MNEFRPAEAFRPMAGLGGPHQQTLFAFFARSWATPPVRRHRWTTPDGDFIDVDVLPADPNAPHLVLIHGLEGSSRSGYVLAGLRAARARGWGALALNFRSCSGAVNLKLRSYSSGETSDPAFALQKLRGEGVRGPLFALGFSLGGNALLKLLAEQGDSSPLAAAVAVSVPFNLSPCATSLDGQGGLISVYRANFLRTLRNKALVKASMFPGELDAARIRRASTIREFDEVVTAKVHGYAGAEDYYARCSSGPLLGRIRRPTLLISSKDDPIAPLGDALANVDNPRLSCAVTEAGGHVGFVAGALRSPRYWSDEVAWQFLDATARAPR